MTISRRGFVGGALAGAVAATTGEASSIERFPGYPGCYGLLHDTTLCVGCRACEVACNEVNGFLPPAEPIGDLGVLERTRRTTETALTVVNRYRAARKGQPPVFRKIQCMHCSEPCCAAVCLVHAFSKTPEGPVLYDPEVCIGCRYCVMACPYYALAYEYDDALTPRVMRCTMCYPRIKKGLNPGCADACPMGAITFGRREDLLKVARDRIQKAPDRYIDHVFGEHELGGTSWLTLAGIPFSELGMPAGSTHEPLTSIGTSYLSVVPLIITIYPGLLAAFYAFTRRRDQVARKELEAALAGARAEAEKDAQQRLARAAEKARKEQDKAVEAAIRRVHAEKQKGDAS